MYLVGLLAAEIAALNLTGVGAYDLYFGMFQFNLYGVFSVITVLLVILFGLDVGPMYKAEKLAIETGKTYSDTDNLIATPPETDFAEDCKLSMANFLAPMITLILTIFAVVFYTGQIWVNGFIGCFGHANIQMAIAMCFLTGVVQDSIPAALIPAILFLIGVVVSFATGSSSLPRMTFCTLSSCLCSGSVIPMLMEGDHGILAVLLIKAVHIQRQLLLDEDHREQIVLIRRIVLQHLDSIAAIGRLQRRRQRPPRRRSPPPSPGWTSSPEGSATTCSCCPSSVTDSSSAHAAVGSRLNAITRHMNRLMMRFFMLLSPLP